jgi:hypothetical protein
MSLLDTVKRLIVGPEAQPIPTMGRNERCWCGSGRKYKACHMAADDRKRSAARAGGPRAAAGRGF